jgi:succinoglycan biosynthesis protein ExoA
VTPFSAGATDGDASGSTPLVSIVMPVLNEEKYLARCLQSVMDQDYPLDKLEVLVVDGMSDDRSREIVAEFVACFPQIKLLDNPQRSIPAAMNIGIRKARGEVIVRVDGHCFLERDYVSQCLRYLRETGADNVGGPACAVGESYVGEAIALALSSPFGHGGSQFRYSQQENYVDTVFLGAFRRDLFDRIGLYDEDLLCAEDYELNHRLRAAKGKILLTSKIRVRYVTRNSLRKFGKQYFGYGFWRMQVIQKHLRALRLRHLMTASFVFILIASGMAGLFDSRFRLLLLTVLLVYLAASLFFSTLLAWKQGWRYLPILPVVFATLHLSWGSGFLWGLVRVCLRRLGFK